MVLSNYHNVEDKNIILSRLERRKTHICVAVTKANRSVCKLWSVIESEKIPFAPYTKGVSNIKRIFEQKNVGSRSFTGFGLLEIPPGGVFPQHTHPDREEVYYVLSGSGTIMVENKEGSAKEGL